MDERKLLLSVQVGSKLYGLNTPSSDEDLCSIAMPFAKDVLGLQPLKEIDNSTKLSSEKRRNTSEDIDNKIYTLPRFVHLLMNSNPEKIEILFARKENILLQDPMINFLFENKNKIVSRRVLKTFLSFALSQKDKLLVKKERFSSLIKASELMFNKFGDDLLDPNAKLNDVFATTLNKSLKHYKGSKNNCESFHEGMSLKMIYEKICSERDNYGWRVRTNSFEKLGFDVKFGYHVIRLMDECRQLLETGEIVYPFTGIEYDELMSVKKGEVEYNNFLKMIDKYEEKVRKVEDSTVLRERPDFNFINNWLIKAQLDYFKREY